MVRYNVNYDLESLEKDRAYYKRTHPDPVTPENFSEEKCDALYGVWNKKEQECTLYGIEDVRQMLDDPTSFRVEVNHPTDVSIFFTIKKVGAFRADKLRMLSIRNDELSGNLYAFQNKAILSLEKGKVPPRFFLK